jgi:hypothetical protein
MIQLEDLFCETCDGNLVRVGDPSTGKFYLVAGHSVSRNFRLKKYREIVFAVCSECEKCGASPLSEVSRENR